MEIYTIMELPFFLKRFAFWTFLYDKQKARIKMQAINATKALLPQTKAALITKAEPLNRDVMVSEMLKEEKKVEVLK